MTLPEILILAFSATACVFSLIAVILVCVKKSGQAGGDTEQIVDNIGDAVNLINDNVRKETSQAKDVVVTAFSTANSATVTSLDTQLKGFGDKIKDFREDVSRALDDMRRLLRENEEGTRNTFSSNLEQVRKEFKQSVDDMRKSVADDLKSVREDNEKQLTEMRKTVEEKLAETLDTRVKNAFEQVNKSLESVQRSFGEMKELTGSVNNLTRVFANVKARGNWGEVSLESLLDQILTPDQYEKQFMIARSENTRVDFAIIMPGQGGEKVYLPIDAKFPITDYENLIAASERGDQAAVALAKKQLADRVRQEAQSINNKYVKPPRTTNFAMLYVPNEGLFAEIIRDGALVADLQAKYRVSVCGPTTVTALLNSLQMGFTSLKIQKKSAEIIKQMSGIRADFAKFTDLLGTVRSRAEKVIGAIDELDKRNDMIGKRLKKVGEIDGGEVALLEVAATGDTEGDE